MQLTRLLHHWEGKSLAISVPRIVKYSRHTEARSIHPITEEFSSQSTRFLLAETPRTGLTSVQRKSAYHASGLSRSCSTVVHVSAAGQLLMLPIAPAWWPQPSMSWLGTSISVEVSPISRLLDSATCPRTNRLYEVESTVGGTKRK